MKKILFIGLILLLGGFLVSLVFSRMFPGGPCGGNGILVGPDGSMSSFHCSAGYSCVRSNESGMDLPGTCRFFPWI